MINFVKYFYRMVLGDVNGKLINLIRKMQHLQRKSEKYSHTYFRRKVYVFLVRNYRNRIYYKYNCDIHPQCKLGSNVSFRHPIGIVIGNGTEIKNNVVILQQVTFGSSHFDHMGYGLPYKQIIGDNCIIGGGAKILGNVTIGNNCIIGANAVVTKNVPNNCTVVGFNKIIYNNESN